MAATCTVSCEMSVPNGTLPLNCLINAPKWCLVSRYIRVVWWFDLTGEVTALGSVLKELAVPQPVKKFITIIIIIIIIIIVYCNWVVTRWQWLFYMYTKYEIG